MMRHYVILFSLNIKPSIYRNRRAEILCLIKNKKHRTTCKGGLGCLLFVRRVLLHGSELGSHPCLPLSVCEPDRVLVLLVKGHAGNAHLLALLVKRRGIRADRLVHVFVELLEIIGANAGLVVLRKASFKEVGSRLLVFLLEVLHVFSGDGAKDSVAVDGRVVVLLVGVVARELLVVVGDVESGIRVTLESAKNKVSERSAGKADIEEDAKGHAVLIKLIDKVLLLSLSNHHDLASDLILLVITNAGVRIEESEFLENTAADKKTRAVR